MNDQPMSPERWLPVVGYESAYEVSDHGRVRSLDRIACGRRIAGRLLCPAPNRKGYLRVKLCREARETSVMVHNIVLAAFVGPRPVDKPETRHLNGNPGDNALTNLRYGTRDENAADRIPHGTHQHLTVTRCVNDHEYTPDNTLWINGRRRCRTCRTASRRAAGARRSERQRAARKENVDA